MNSTIFVPIRSKEDLEKIKPNQENFWCDFKQRIGNTPDFELAKDVAAFVNALGGTLLIGAVEIKERFSHFTPLNKADALQTQEKYEDAVDKRCIPKPLVDIIIIENVKGKDGNKGCVVAVNIFPFPGQMIGVKMKGDSKDDFGGDGYRFPIRFSNQTTYLEPNQFSMFMLPELRRKIILLSQINKNDTVFIYHLNEHGNRTQNMYKYIKINEFSNNVEFSLAGTKKLFLPIDAISLIYKYDQNWIIQVDGKVETNDVIAGGNNLFSPTQ
jgi:hypothetical protein